MPSSAVSSPTVIGLEHAGILMEPEEFDAIEHWDEEYRYELIHGVLIVSPYAAPAERSPNERLGHWLLKYQESHPQGRSLNLTLPEHTVRTARNRRRADRVLWAGLGRKPNVRRDTPTVIAEFVSKDRRDRKRDYEEKRGEYLAMDVAEYWIIDRFRRIMTVHRNGKRVRKIVVQEADVYRTGLLPGFELRPADLFAALDEFEDE